MTYSCNDFSEDVCRCLIDSAVVEPEAFSDADIAVQADLAIAGIIGAAQAARAARFISTVLASSRARHEETLADALRLADAIANQCTLILAPARAPFAEFVAALPGGTEWSRHLVVQPR
ncbi:hypothetical protein [Paraburkholderia tropica]|uniref:hypothetical protein n=1 Tax=Paraburkholderia tropica TaxID=92647 RepID=UPI0007EDE0CE|nr:hypothetical protein [Paraburkholderia tropica]OBR53983.1 hypothetical protein A6456_21870 [Paraburkholderia tropica]